MITFSEMIEESQGYLEYFCEDNTKSELYNSVGFCARFSEFINSEEGPDYVESIISKAYDEGKLGQDAIISLTEYGYIVGGMLSETSRKRYHVHFIDLSASPKDFDDMLLKKLRVLGDRLYIGLVNIIVVVPFDTEADAYVLKPIYSEKFSLLAKNFETKYKSSSPVMYTTDLYRDCSKNFYGYKCVESRTLDVTTLLPIDSQSKLDLLINNLQSSGIGSASSSVTSNLDIVSYACLAYASLRTCIPIISDCGEFTQKLVMQEKRLFSREWNSKLRLEHLGNLQRRNLILSDKGSNFLVGNIKIKDEYKAKVLPLSSALSETEEAVLRHIVMADYMTVISSDFLDPTVILEQLFSFCDSNISDLRKLLKKVQVMCMYHLTDRLVSISDINWIELDGDLYFCIIDEFLSECEVDVLFSNSSSVSRSCRYKDLLPLYIMDYSLNTDLPRGVLMDTLVEQKANLPMCELSFSFLYEMYSGMSSSSKRFNDLCLEGKFAEALLKVNDPNRSENEKFYQLSLRRFGKELIDKLPVDLSGSFEPHFSMGSLI